MTPVLSRGAAQVATSLVVAGNGLAGAVSTSGAGSVDPVVWLALALGLHALWRAGRDRPVMLPDLIVLLAVAVVCLLPSARIAWLAGAAAFGWLAWRDDRSDGHLPAGIAIMLAVTLREPATWLLTTLFAEQLLRADAVLAGTLASLFLPIENIHANIIVAEGGHNLFVMTGCSSVTNLSLALLFWFSVTRSLGIRAGLGHAALLGAVIVGVNVVRLAAMTMSPASYVWLHDGDGAVIITLLTAVLTAAVTWSSMEKPHAAPHPA